MSDNEIGPAPSELFIQQHPLPASAMEDVIKEIIPNAFFNVPDNRSELDRRAADLLRAIDREFPEQSTREAFLILASEVIEGLAEMLELGKEIREEMKETANSNRDVPGMSVRGQLYQFKLERVSDPGIHLEMALDAIETYATKIKNMMASP